MRPVEGSYARALVPISWPQIGALLFDVGAEPAADGGAVHVWFELGGEDLGTFRVDAGTSALRVPVLRPHQGIVPLRMRVVGGTLGFSRLELLDPTPSPSALEAGRLEALGERRRAWRRARHPSVPALPVPATPVPAMPVPAFPVRPAEPSPAAAPVDAAASARFPFARPTPAFDAAQGAADGGGRRSSTVIGR